MVSGKEKRNYLKAIKYEFIVGARITKGRYIVTIFLFLLIVRFLIFQGNINFWDFCVKLWEGIPVYKRSENSVFILPALLMFVQTVLFFVVGSYPTKEIQDYGKFSFLYSSRKQWWVRKSVWIFVNIGIFFVVLYFMIGLGTVIKTKDWSSLSIINASVAKEMSASNYRRLLVWCFLLPFMVSEVFGILQLFISVYVKPIYGYLMIEIILVLSAYFTNPFLIGNYMMLLRADVFLQNSCINLEWGTVYCILLYTFLFTIGFILISTKDILYKKDDVDE